MLKLTKSLYQSIPGGYHLINNGQITEFNGVMLTNSGCMALSVNGSHRSLLEPNVAEEATQLMIDNGIVISKESDKVGV
jgi:hypothetical protein